MVLPRGETPQDGTARTRTVGKSICRGCPVLATCREHALKVGEARNPDCRDRPQAGDRPRLGLAGWRAGAPVWGKAGAVSDDNVLFVHWHDRAAYLGVYGRGCPQPADGRAGRRGILFTRARDRAAVLTVARIAVHRRYPQSTD